MRRGRARDGGRDAPGGGGPASRQLRARLEAQGWRVLLDQDGVVTLRRP